MIFNIGIKLVSNIQHYVDNVIVIPETEGDL